MTAYNDFLASLELDGFAEFDLGQNQILLDMQNLIKTTLPIEKFNDSQLDFDNYAVQIKSAVDEMAKSQLVKKLLMANKNIITTLCGPDVDYQDVPHIRVARPQAKTDVTGWHRDTFYGNTPYELNIWFPVFPLPTGSGLLLCRKSHKVPAKNVRPAEIPYEVAKDRRVDRGSVANQIGFLYTPQTEDGIENMNPEDAVLVAPKFGHAILFFASTLHAGATGIEGPRISIDTRVRNSRTPTNTKHGFYTPLFRGLVSESAEQFLGH